MTSVFACLPTRARQARLSPPLSPPLLPHHTTLILSGAKPATEVCGQVDRYVDGALGDESRRALFAEQRSLPRAFTQCLPGLFPPHAALEQENRPTRDVHKLFRTTTRQMRDIVVRQAESQGCGKRRKNQHVSILLCSITITTAVALAQWFRNELPSCPETPERPRWYGLWKFTSRIRKRR